MPHTEYTFWLMPAELLKSRLQGVIRDLAREFNAPEFDAHVTFYHGKSSAEEAASIAEEITNEFSPVELEAEGLDHLAQYTKAFFMQFAESEVLNNMFEKVRDSVAAPAPYILNPHLSLLYGTLTGAQRQELCLRPLAPAGKWRFDAIRVVEFESPITEQSIREWRVVGDYGLREGYRRREDDLK